MEEVGCEWAEALFMESPLRGIGVGEDVRGRTACCVTRADADSWSARRAMESIAALKPEAMVNEQAGLEQQRARSEGGLLRKQYSEGSMMVLKPDWTDLMMWAVCMGCEPLARVTQMGARRGGATTNYRCF